MALVFGGFEGYITVVDNGGNQATLRYQLRELTDPAAALADLQAILADLDAVTDATIKSYALTQRFIEDNLVLPAVGVQVENRATVIAQLASSPLKKWTFHIPAPNQGIFVGAAGGPTADTVDVTDEALQAYVSNFHASGTAYASDGEDVANIGNAGLIEGRRTHRQSSFG